MKINAVIPLFVLCCFGLSAQAGDDRIEFRGEGSGKDHAEARAGAIKDITVQIGIYMFALVKSDLQERLVYESENGKTIRDSEFTGSETQIISEMAVSNIAIDREYPRPGQGSFALTLTCVMSKSSLERQKNQYLQGVTESYAAQMRYLTEQGGGLAAAVRGRADIIRALDKNPIHRAIAWLDIPEGRVNLYDYLASQINGWTGSLVFAPIPDQKAPRGGRVNTAVKVSSPLYAAPLGQLEYSVRIFLPQGTAVLAYTVTGGGNLVLSLPPAELATGKYRVRVEPVFAGISRTLPGAEFFLEVTPPQKPFSPGPLGGRWSGVISYTAQGQNYRDSYTISIYDNGSCWVTIRARDGAVQEGEGRWSGEDGVFSLDCGFENPAIPRLSVLRWVGMYKLESNRHRLKMNIKPAPDYSGVVGLTLDREQ